MLLLQLWMNWNGLYRVLYERTLLTIYKVQTWNQLPLQRPKWNYILVHWAWPYKPHTETTLYHYPWSDGAFWCGCSETTARHSVCTKRRRTTKTTCVYAICNLITTMHMCTIYWQNGYIYIRPHFDIIITSIKTHSNDIRDPFTCTGTNPVSINFVTSLCCLLAMGLGWTFGDNPQYRTLSQFEASTILIINTFDKTFYHIISIL